MDTATMAVVVAATIFWGTTEAFFWVASNKQGGEVECMVHTYLYAWVLALVLGFEAYLQGWHLTPKLLGLGAITALTYFGGQLAICAAFKLTGASRAAGLASTYPVLTSALLCLGGAPFRVLMVLGIILSAFGIWLLYGAEADTGNTKKLLGLLGITVMMWSIVPISDNAAVQLAGPFPTLLSVAIFQCVIWTIVVIHAQLKGNAIRWRQASFAPFAWAAGACAMIGNVAYTFALQWSADAGYVAGITAMYPVITFILSVMFLGEGWNKRRLAGILVAALGVIVVQLAH